MAFSSKHPHLSGIIFDINPLFLPTELDLEIDHDYDLTHANSLLEFDYEYLVETKCLTEGEEEATTESTKSLSKCATIQNSSNETKSLNDLPPPQQQQQQQQQLQIPSSDVNDKPTVAVVQPILPSTTTSTHNTPVNVNHTFLANSQNPGLNIAQQKSALSSNSTSSIYNNNNNSNQPPKSSSPIPIPIPVVQIPSSSSAQMQLQSSPLNHVNIPPKPMQQQQLQLQQIYQPTSLPTTTLAMPTINHHQNSNINQQQHQQQQYVNHNHSHTTILQPILLTKPNSQRSSSLLNMPLSFNSNELLIPTKNSDSNNSNNTSSNSDLALKQPVNNQTNSNEQQQQQQTDESQQQQQQQQQKSVNNTNSTTTNGLNNSHKRYDHLFLEHSTLDPFNDMELKTINDIEELRSILQHSTFTSSSSSTILPPSSSTTTGTTALTPLKIAATTANSHANTPSKLSTFHNLDINSNNLSVIESKK